MGATIIGLSPPFPTLTTATTGASASCTTAADTTAGNLLPDKYYQAVFQVLSSPGGGVATTGEQGEQKVWGV